MFFIDVKFQKKILLKARHVAKYFTVKIIAFTLDLEFKKPFFLSFKHYFTLS